MTYQLIHGDCSYLLKTIARVGWLLTDPPYGIKRDVGFGDSAAFGNGGGPDDFTKFLKTARAV